MTSTLIENLVERVSQKHSVSPHILFDEIALNLNERFHNYHVVDSLDEIDWAFCSEHFMYESFRERVTVEEKPEINTPGLAQNMIGGVIYQILKYGEHEK